MRHTINIASSDIGETEAFVSDVYAPVSLRAVGDHLEYGVVGSVANFDGLAVEWSKTIGSYEIKPLEEFDSVVFNLMTAESMRYHLRRDEVELGQASMIAYRHPDKVDVLHNSQHTTVAISDSLLQKRLSLLLDGAGVRGVDFSCRPVSRAVISKLCNFLCDLKTSPMMALAELMRHRTEIIADLIVDAFLLGYPNSFSEILSNPVPLVAPRHVKRAVDYINSHPQERLSPEFLASLSSVSIRSLQYSFKAFTGQTITEYQHLLKLRFARDEIQRHPEIKITKVAKKWGFGSLAAFGQSFKKVYGITPSLFAASCR